MQCTEMVIGRSSATTSRPFSRYASIAAALCLLSAIVACSGDSPTAARSMPTPSALLAAVTGPAADAIANGQIQLAAAAGVEEKELTASEAVNLASAWTRERGPMTRSWLESTRGADINFKTLKNCGRTLYARSAFNSSPQNIPGPYRRGHGPWWLVTFCDGVGSPSVSVAVAAWANELTIQAGKIRFPMVSGTEFVAIGIPVGHVGEYPMPPEIAVEIAAQRAGKRVAKVPELVTPLPSDGPPQLARWRLTLEAPVTARTESGARPTTEVFMGPTVVGGTNLAISVGAPEQPASIEVNWIPVPRVGEARDSYAARAINQTSQLLRRADIPVRVEPISAWGN